MIGFSKCFLLRHYNWGLYYSIVSDSIRIFCKPIDSMLCQSIESMGLQKIPNMLIRSNRSRIPKKISPAVSKMWNNWATSFTTCYCDSLNRTCVSISFVIQPLSLSNLTNLHPCILFLPISPSSQPLTFIQTPETWENIRKEELCTHFACYNGCLYHM